MDTQPEIGALLARGRTADVHEWLPGYVIKKYQPWMDRSSVEYEQRVANAVHASGLPVPAVGEIYRFGEVFGLVYARMAGKPMGDVLQKKPWLVFAEARRMARLHTEMHANATRPDLPAQHARLQRKIEAGEPLTVELKAAALRALEQLPAGERICHGDFHPGNVLIDGDRAVTIDWIDASLGNPLADVARTTVLLEGTIASHPPLPWIIRLLVRTFHTQYLKTYFQLKPGGEAEYRRWLPVVAAGRLSENIPEVEAYLLRVAGALL